MTDAEEIQKANVKRTVNNLVSQGHYQKVDDILRKLPIKKMPGHILIAYMTAIQEYIGKIPYRIEFNQAVKQELARRQEASDLENTTNES